MKDFKRSSSLSESFLYGCTVEIEVRKPVGSLLKASRHEMKVSRILEGLRHLNRAFSKSVHAVFFS